MSPEISPPFVHRLTIGYLMTYDSESDRVIFFGGWPNAIGRTRTTGDTWAYDYNTNTWTNITPTISPPRRYWTQGTYDSESDRVILFGGWGVSSSPLDDTWAYDYNTNTWVEMKPARKPSPEYGSAMAYDSQSDRVILFKAWESRDKYMEKPETWAYDYNTNT